MSKPDIGEKIVCTIPSAFERSNCISKRQIVENYAVLNHLLAFSLEMPLWGCPAGKELVPCSQMKLQLQYSPRAVLENPHCCAGWKIPLLSTSFLCSSCWSSTWNGIFPRPSELEKSPLWTTWEEYKSLSAHTDYKRASNQLTGAQHPQWHKYPQVFQIFVTYACRLPKETPGSSHTLCCCALQHWCCWQHCKYPSLLLQGSLVFLSPFRGAPRSCSPPDSDSSSSPCTGEETKRIE